MKDRIRSEGTANAALASTARMTSITAHNAYAPRPDIAIARAAVTKARRARRVAHMSRPLEVVGAAFAFVVSAVGFGGAQ